MEISKINGNQYSLKDIVAIRNPKQQKLYIKNELYPVDMYVSTDSSTNEDKLVMLFSRAASKPLYKLWEKHELK